jgi:hypothetical protein
MLNVDGVECVIKQLQHDGNAVFVNCSHPGNMASMESEMNVDGINMLFARLLEVGGLQDDKRLSIVVDVDDAVVLFPKMVELMTKAERMNISMMVSVHTLHSELPCNYYDREYNHQMENHSASWEC